MIRAAAAQEMQRGVLEILQALRRERDVPRLVQVLQQHLHPRDDALHERIEIGDFLDPVLNVAVDGVGHGPQPTSPSPHVSTVDISLTKYVATK
ncbi:MAG: hypothetical protein ACRDN0_15575 [Trebonia sp.]